MFNFCIIFKVFIFVSIIATYCHCASNKHLEIKDKGVLPLSPKSIGFQFFLDVNNTSKIHTYSLEAVGEKCCLVFQPNEVDCDGMEAFGGNYGSIAPKTLKRIILVSPTLYQLNKNGSCLIRIISNVKNKSYDNFEKINFDTIVNENNLKNIRYISKKNLKACKQIDEDPLNDCLAIDCEKFYNGKRQVLDKNTKVCYTVPECVPQDISLPNVVLSPELSKCKAPDNIITETDISTVKVISKRELSNRTSKDILIFAEAHDDESDSKKYGMNKTSKIPMKAALIEPQVLCEVPGKGDLFATLLFGISIGLQVAIVIIIGCTLAYAFQNFRRNRRSYSGPNFDCPSLLTRGEGSKRSSYRKKGHKNYKSLDDSSTLDDQSYTKLTSKPKIIPCPGKAKISKGTSICGLRPNQNVGTQLEGQAKFIPCQCDEKFRGVAKKLTKELKGKSNKPLDDVKPKSVPEKSELSLPKEAKAEPVKTEEAAPANAIPPDATPANRLPPNATPLNTVPSNAEPPNAVPSNSTPPNPTPPSMPPEATPPEAKPPGETPPNPVPSNIPAEGTVPEVTPANEISPNPVPAGEIPPEGNPSEVNPPEVIHPGNIPAKTEAELAKIGETVQNTTETTIETKIEEAKTVVTNMVQSVPNVIQSVPYMTNEVSEEKIVAISEIEMSPLPSMLRTSPKRSQIPISKLSRNSPTIENSNLTYYMQRENLYSRPLTSLYQTTETSFDRTARFIDFAKESGIGLVDFLKGFGHRPGSEIDEQDNDLICGMSSDKTPLLSTSTSSTPTLKRSEHISKEIQSIQKLAKNLKSSKTDVNLAGPSSKPSPKYYDAESVESRGNQVDLEDDYVDTILKHRARLLISQDFTSSEDTADDKSLSAMFRKKKKDPKSTRDITKIPSSAELEMVHYSKTLSASTSRTTPNTK